MAKWRPTDERTMNPLTESALARNLMRVRYRRSWCLPRYTPVGWWECDVFEITQAGYFREYEIKLTVADFKADRMKDRPIRENEGWRPNTPRTTKQAQLNGGDRLGPVRFWYVCPKGVLTAEMVPDWAGLIEMERWKTAPQYMAEVETKKAPSLHRQKCDPAIAEHAKSVVYYRLHQMIQRRK